MCSIGIGLKRFLRLKKPLMEMLSPAFTLSITKANSPNATAFISTSTATSAFASRCVDWWISVRCSVAIPPGVVLSVSRDATFPSSTVWFVANYVPATFVSACAYGATEGLKRLLSPLLSPLLSQLPCCPPGVPLSRHPAGRPTWISLPSSSVTGRFQPRAFAPSGDAGRRR